ncbi:MAG: hypothetical protein AB8B74_02145 [Crocinitomicaceae bacterium]
MKIIFLFTGILMTLASFPQKPEKVYSIVKERRSEDWYKTQSELWKKETEKNKKNAEAWYYYFAANRALKNISWSDKAAMEKYVEVCDGISKAAYKAVPNSFEANHIVWWHSFSDPKKFSYLEKAYTINPLDSRTYRDMMIHYLLKFDEAKTLEFAEKIYKVNDMPAAAYNWAYNLLSEVEPNAIILTAGDNDTYLPWIVQQVMGFRKDVTIMNTSLLGLDDYRNELFKRKGFPVFDKSLNDAVAYEQSLEIQKEMFAHIFAQNDNSPVYIASTAIQQFQEKFDDNLYLTGLSYKYCENALDNVALIKRNYEKRYLLDYLLNKFSFHPLDKKTDDFNVYYLQAFIKLHRHYLDSEDLAKAEVLKDRIISIGNKGGQESWITKWMNDINQ